MIKDDGSARFYGATSSVDWVMSMNDGTADESLPLEHHVPLSQGQAESTAALDSMIREFPLPSVTGTIGKDVMMDRAIAELPNRDTAISMVNRYYLRVSWVLVGFFHSAVHGSKRSSASVLFNGSVLSETILGRATRLHRVRILHSKTLVCCMPSLL